jgi:hypothetical protein
MLDTARMFARYAIGLRDFFRSTLSEQECLRLVQDQLANRQQAFLQILQRGVYDNPRSPYRKLLEHAEVRLSDAERLVSLHGVEGALKELRDRGIYVSIDEFKTRKPIRRAGLEFSPRPRDFDNPLLIEHYESRTGGSRGSRTRLMIDLDLLTYEAAQTHLFLSEFGLSGAPAGMWRELPPGMVGIKNWLRYAKLGRGFEKWFAQRKPLARAEDVKFHLFTVASGVLGRLFGKPMPKPEHVRANAAARIARWMAQKKSQGLPALMDTNTSLGARISIAAKEQGLDISGSFFRFSAEPYTPARARLVEEAGCRAASFYSAAEIGYIGLACGDPEHVDEVHLMTDKVAMIQWPRRVAEDGASVDSFLFTTVLRSCPKLMLNVEIGDYGAVRERRCGCLLDRMGFHVHMHDIRSFEKLTSSGPTFLGTELIALIEEVLPARFGGNQVDYQFVEEEENGLPRVSLLVAPRLGRINECEVVETVLSHLRAVPSGGMMTDVWRDSDTLRVVRREPYSTGAMKLLPLHILRRTRGG